MMKILYLHQYFVPPTAHGGTRSYEFARRLIANGHQVRLITSSAYLGPEYTATRRITEAEVGGIPVTIINIPYSNAMGFLARIRAFLQFAVLASYAALRYRPDVVFATSTPLTIAIPGLITKLVRGVPMVFEVRDLWPELPIAIGALRNPLLKWLAYGLEKLAYRGSMHVVALSPGMADGVVRQGVSPTSVTVIPNSCDTQLFNVPQSRGERIREKLGLAGDQALVVYTGTFGLINGVGYLVEVAAAMRTIDPSVRFLLVGDGAEARKIAQQAQELQVLNQNLWIWEPIAKEQMPDLLAAATVATSLFIPLRPMWNNSANKFFDALAAGKPIAINYGGWQAELLEHSGAGIVMDPGDRSRAASQLAAFLRDRQLLEHAAAASRTLAHEEFNRDLMALKLELVLKQAVEDHQ